MGLKGLSNRPWPWRLNEGSTRLSFPLTAVRLHPQIVAQARIGVTCLSAEDSQVAEIIRVNAAVAPSVPGKARRAQHAKHHGCVTAIFEVRTDVPADLRQGLFAEPQRYTAHIRFSNSRQ